jgi:hypothetical protein
VTAGQLDAVRHGAWEALAAWRGVLPTAQFQCANPDPSWPKPVQDRFQREQSRCQARLGRLDRRLHRDATAQLLGGDPERLRQALFPFGLPQERVIPGVSWLRNGALLDAILERMDGATPVILVEEP